MGFHKLLEAFQVVPWGFRRAFQVVLEIFRGVPGRYRVEMHLNVLCSKAVLLRAVFIFKPWHVFDHSAQRS